MNRWPRAVCAPRYKRPQPCPGRRRWRNIRENLRHCESTILSGAPSTASACCGHAGSLAEPALGAPNELTYGPEHYVSRIKIAQPARAFGRGAADGGRRQHQIDGGLGRAGGGALFAVRGATAPGTLRI